MYFVQAMIGTMKVAGEGGNKERQRQQGPAVELVRWLSEQERWREEARREVEAFF